MEIATFYAGYFAAELGFRHLKGRIMQL